MVVLVSYISFIITRVVFYFLTQLNWNFFIDLQTFFLKKNFYYYFLSNKQTLSNSSKYNLFSFNKLYLLYKYFYKKLKSNSQSILLLQKFDGVIFFSIFFEIIVNMSLTLKLFSRRVLELFCWINLFMLSFNVKFFNKINLLGKVDSLSNFSNSFNLKFTSIRFINKNEVFKGFGSILKNVVKGTKNKIASNIKILSSFSSKFEINFNPSSLDKYIFNSTIINKNKSNILFLRKNKVFNKGRYSRNRQYYRTGVYWCLYVNIVAVVGMYFWFYRFTMNFGYLWWFFYGFIASFIFSKLVKYNFYQSSILINEVLILVKWVGVLFQSFFYNFKVLNRYNNFYLKKYYLSSKIIKKFINEHFIGSVIIPNYNLIIQVRLLYWQLINFFMVVNPQKILYLKVTSEYINNPYNFKIQKINFFL